MAISAQEPALNADQYQRDDLKGHVILIYVVAVLQTFVPLLLGGHLFALLGPIIGIFGFLIGRRHIWAAVLLAIFGITNAFFLALGKSFGGTFLTIFMVASCFMSIGIIRKSRGADRTIANNPEPIVERQMQFAMEHTSAQVTIPRPEKGPSMNTFTRRMLLVIAGSGAMAIAIALGASSQQGGLLGAAIILSFWGMVKQKSRES